MPWRSLAPEVGATDQMPAKRKRQRLRAATSSNDDEAAARATRRRAEGQLLLNKLIGLYASGRRMTAKDFCIRWWHALKAETPGGDFDVYAKAPGDASQGHYQRHLDSVLPPPANLYTFRVPGVYNRRSGRQQRDVLGQLV